MANGHWPFHIRVDGLLLKGAMISKLEITQELGDHSWCEVEFKLLEKQRVDLETYIGKSFEFICKYVMFSFA